MIKKIKGLKKFTDCSVPSNEAERISKAKVSAYNQAIDDVVKLCNLQNVSNNEVAVCEHKFDEPVTWEGVLEYYKCSKCGAKQTDC